VCEIKTCSRCGRNLPADRLHFYVSKGTRGGLYSSCRECGGREFLKPEPFIKDGHKICTKCKRELPATTYYFSKDKECRFGVCSICKECRGYKFMEVMKVVDGYKECIVCHKKLPFTREYFYSTGYTLRADCKECASKQSKTKYDENNQHKRQYARDWYQKHCSNNKEYLAKAVIRSTQYSIANRHRQSYKTSLALRSQRRRALAHDLPSTLTVEQWNSIKEHFAHKCAYCGKDKNLTYDHFIPLKKGGGFTYNNVIPACRNCNSQKSAKDFTSWFRGFKHYSPEREAKILSYLGYVNGIQQLSLV